mgnify:CR=1 FL=1
MAAFFRLLVLAPVGVLVVLLAVANRAPVQLALDPTGGNAFVVTVPLFVALLAAMMGGILIGGVACWLGQGKHRKAARQAAREADKARAETERLRLLAPTLAALPPR